MTYYLLIAAGMSMTFGWLVGRKAGDRFMASIMWFVVLGVVVICSERLS